jgi:polysaccharide pyruvyl transferase WcaK-like protein
MRLTTLGLQPAAIRKIGLLNHMGGGNLGDDATQVAVIQHIKSRWPNSQIFLFSMNPADTRPRHGTPAYPIRTETWYPDMGQHRNGTEPVKKTIRDTLRKFHLLARLARAANKTRIKTFGRVLGELRFLGKSLLIIRSFELLVISGGGQLLDAWGGPWKFPYTIFKWTLLAKLSRTKCYFLNVGAGPVAHPLAKWFVRNALGLADYVSFRDASSRELAQSVGYKGESQVSVDCVYALDASSRSLCSKTREQDSIVGISPMAYCDPRVYWQQDKGAYENYIQTVASFGGWLAQNHYRLAVFSTDIWFDLRTTEEVTDLLRRANRDLASDMVKLERIGGIDHLFSTMQAVDYMVTCRFHGVVFAHLLNKPVLALSHHPKVSTLMSDLGLARYCLDIRKCKVNALQEAFLSMIANQDEIRSRMATKAACYKRTLVAQFDQLFPQGVRI